MNPNELFSTDWRQYLRAISQHPLLEPAQELELARQINVGRQAARLAGSANNISSDRRVEREQLIEMGRRARERLIESNLRLVISIAGRYAGRGLSVRDLIQEGNIAPQLGIDKYNWRRGFRLSTYVYWWIRQAMTRSLAASCRFIRLPVNAGNLLCRGALLEQRLEADLGRKPALAELAAELGVPPGRLRAIGLAASAPASLDTPLADDSERTRGDLVSHEPVLTTMQSAGGHDELADQVEAALDDLPPREREVLRLHYGRGNSDVVSLLEIGTRLGVTRERARQLEGRALRRFRGDRRLRRALIDLKSALVETLP